MNHFSMKLPMKVKLVEGKKRRSNLKRRLKDLFRALKPPKHEPKKELKKARLGHLTLAPSLPLRGEASQFFASQFRCT